MNHIRRFITCLGFMSMLCLSACIKNDIDYPLIKLQIVNLEVDGQLGNAVINTDSMTVTVDLADTVDLKKVLVKKLEVTEGAKSDLLINTMLNLTSPQKITLSLYQDYEWKVVGKQTIDRRFVVENQIGVAAFDIAHHKVVVNVSMETNLRKIKIKELKLGPTGATINGASSVMDFSLGKRNVIVMYRDIMEEWELYVIPTDIVVFTSSVDAWTNVAWLYGQGKEGNENGFEIREVSSDKWEKVGASYVTSNGGNFSARVPHLKASTNYICRAFSGENMGQELSFTTDVAASLPDGNFDNWHLSGKKLWNPWKEGGVPFWDTGNSGVVTVGDSNSTPTSDTWNKTGQAAKLESKYVVIKFAAGNLFMGDFIRIDGTNGILNFGKSFVTRPTKLKGHYKYIPSNINRLPDSSNAADYDRFKNYKGRPDTCSVFVALGDWSEPLEIRTNPKNRKLFDKNDSHVIAYAEFNSGDVVTEYKSLNLELSYRATNRIPTYLIIVCSASKYGDYFVGGDGSVLYVDDFSLEYDY